MRSHLYGSGKLRKNVADGLAERVASISTDCTPRHQRYDDMEILATGDYFRTYALFMAENVKLVGYAAQRGAFRFYPERLPTRSARSTQQSIVHRDGQGSSSRDRDYDRVNRKHYIRVCIGFRSINQVGARDGGVDRRPERPQDRAEGRDAVARGPHHLPDVGAWVGRHHPL